MCLVIPEAQLGDTAVRSYCVPLTTGGAYRWEYAFRSALSPCHSSTLQLIYFAAHEDNR